MADTVSVIKVLLLSKLLVLSKRCPKLVVCCQLPETIVRALVVLPATGDDGAFIWWYFQVHWRCMYACA